MGPAESLAAKGIMLWANTSRLSRLEDVVAALSKAVAELSEALRGHVTFCTERERNRDKEHIESERSRDKEHLENRAAIIELQKAVRDNADAQNAASRKALWWFIGILAAVLGSILVQSFHFKVYLG